MSKLSQLKQDAYQAGKKRNWAQAIALYEEILDKDKNNPTVINELGDLCLRAGDTNAAVRHFLSAAAKYRQTGLLNNAVAIYKKILRYDADNQNAHWYLAETRASQGLAMEGEEHALLFLQNAGKVAGDIKEIFIKRCAQLFELMPEGEAVHTELVQVFNFWQLPLESARALCLVAAARQTAGDADTARARIDEALARSPEVTNYVEYARWDRAANPHRAAPVDHVAVFGAVDLEPAVGQGPVAVPLAAPVDEEPSSRGLFGDIDISGSAPAAQADVAGPVTFADDDDAPVATHAFDVDEVEEEAVEFDISDGADEDAVDAVDDDALPTGVRRVADILAQSDPTRDEKDGDGCFEIDGGEDLEALVREALAKSRLHRAPAAAPATPAAPVSRREPGDDPLSRILNAAPEDSTGHDSSQLATIASEIGAVVGGSGEDADAERLYEMGMVYLEMGLYDQACESFSTAACDENYAVRAHEMWGITLQRADRLGEAITVLKDGLAHAPAGSREQHGLRYHLGRAYEQAGQDEQATECYRAIRAEDAAFLDVGQRLRRLVTV